MRISSLFLIALAGCGHNVYFSDDEGGPRASDSALHGHDDELSLPWAAGTRVKVALRGVDDDMSAWKVTSDKPEIVSVDRLVVDDDHRLTAELTAANAGETG